MAILGYPKAGLTSLGGRFRRQADGVIEVYSSRTVAQTIESDQCRRTYLAAHREKPGGADMGDMADRYVSYIQTDLGL